MIERHTLSSGDVARISTLSVERVRQLDTVLQPVRRGNGQRRYDPRVVEQFVRRRAVRASR